MQISKKLREELAAAGLVIVPREPTEEMKAAAYYAGGVGDHGEAERASFEAEWEAAIKQHTTRKKPTGLLRLVRPYEL